MDWFEWVEVVDAELEELEEQPSKDALSWLYRESFF